MQRHACSDISRVYNDVLQLYPDNFLIYWLSDELEHIYSIIMMVQTKVTKNMQPERSPEGELPCIAFLML